jgi:hypothetical protein
MRIRGKSLRGTAVVAVAALGLLAGCNWQKSSLHQVTVTDTAAGLAGVPSAIPAGQYNFNLKTALPDGNIQLAKIGPDYSIQQLFADVPVVFGPPSKAFKAAAERFYTRTTFAGGRTGTGSYSTYLTPGNYIVTDTDTGKYAPFKVTPASVVANYPKSNLSLTGIMGMKNGKDTFGWIVSGNYAKSGVLKFNALNGDEPHVLSVSILHPGKTIADCAAYQGTGPAPCDEVLTTGLISPLTSMTIPYHFAKAGNYVIACFVPDADTGMPHSEMGMVTTIKLH